MTHTKPNIPLVTDDDFTPFLRWLVSEHNYNEKNIIDVVEKPYHYKKQYAEYIERAW